MTREFLRLPHAVGPEDLAELRDSILSSPFVGSSPLAGSFRASRGFAMAFKREGLGELYRRFPALAVFADLALAPDALRRLTPWPRRWLTQTTAPNAFYLNLLMVPAGAGVGLHVDATLREHCGDDTVIPMQVSVLYLQVPEGMTGGELLLRRNHRDVRRLPPQEGAVVHFRGDLTHGVADVIHDDPSALRVSLVCEQYVLSPEALRTTPVFKVYSKAGFRAYLEDQGQRPARSFDLEQ